jgi:hypothetical protein
MHPRLNTPPYRWAKSTCRLHGAAYFLGILSREEQARVEEFAFQHDHVRQGLAAWDGDLGCTRERRSVLRLNPAPAHVAVAASVHPIRSLTLHNWKPQRR